MRFAILTPDGASADLSMRTPQLEKVPKALEAHPPIPPLNFPCGRVGCRAARRSHHIHWLAPLGVLAIAIRHESPVEWKLGLPYCIGPVIPEVDRAATSFAWGDGVKPGTRAEECL